METSPDYYSQSTSQHIPLPLCLKNIPNLDTNMFWKKKPKYQTTQITKDNFEELVLKSDKPVLLDFYADWCGPCKVLGPIIDELAQENEGKALVAKVNTQNNPELSQHFKIKSIPTMIFFHKGEMTERFQGLIPKPNLQEIIDEYAGAQS